MNEYILAYITTANEAEAMRIGRSLVERRIAACANVIPAMRSIYRWKGDLCEDEEAVLIVKSTAARENELTEAVLALHSYECPCLAIVPIRAGNPAYFDWITESTTVDPGAADRS